MFVKFPIEIFERDAFQNFSAQQEFSLGNGRALMWVSQLAYQIEDVPALKNVLDAWGFRSRPNIRQTEPHDCYHRPLWRAGRRGYPRLRRH
jgi:hypothetical protein